VPQIHATAVSIKGNGIVLCGDSGAGKSDLGLRMIDRGARLVADDRCDLNMVDDQLIASCPQTIFGLMEVRGIGILRFECEGAAPVRLIVELCDASDIERLPEQRMNKKYGIEIPTIRIAPFEASAATKIIVALGHVLGEIESQSA
jgi:HPr kinase/phosphorylase